MFFIFPLISAFSIDLFDPIQSSTFGGFSANNPLTYLGGDIIYSEHCSRTEKEVNSWWSANFNESFLVKEVWVRSNTEIAEVLAGTIIFIDDKICE